jgi:hypothetical protein
MEILNTPGEFYSVHDDLIFTVRDSVKAADPVTYPDYRYICDVYVGAELVTRLKAYPRPDNNIGVFNISNILRNYITPVFEPAIPGIFTFPHIIGNGLFNVSGTCIFGEEYGFTMFPNVSGVTGQKYYGHYNGRKLGVNTNLAAYSGKPATVRPYKNYVTRTGKHNYIPYLGDGNQVNLEARLYNSLGVELDNGTHLTIPVDNGDLGSFNISIAAMESTGWMVIPEDTAYYVISFTDPDPVIFYRFDIICEPKYEQHTLHFLNRFGGWETKVFNKVSRKTIDIEKKDFGKVPYTIDTDGVPTYYTDSNVYNETRSVYSSQYREKVVLNSDILTDGEYAWLADLILSPMVYIEMLDSSDEVFFVPVVIASNNYDFKKKVNDKVTNLTLSIEFGDQLNAQYR